MCVLYVCWCLTLFGHPSLSIQIPSVKLQLHLAARPANSSPFTIFPPPLFFLELSCYWPISVPMRTLAVSNTFPLLHDTQYWRLVPSHEYLKLFRNMNQIVTMKYRGLSINYAGMGVDMKIDMGLEVFVSRFESIQVFPSVVYYVYRGVTGISRPVHVQLVLCGNSAVV